MVARLIFIIKLLDISKTRVICSATAAFVSAICDGICIALLVPVLRGLFQANFDSLYKIPWIGNYMMELSGDLHQNKTFVFLVLLLVIFLAGFLKAVFQFLSLVLISYEASRGGNSLRIKIFNRYLSFGKLFFDKRNAGDLHQILMNYTEHIMLSFRGVSAALQASFASILYLFLMTKISLLLTLIVFSVFPLIHFVLSTVIKKIYLSSMDFEKTFKELGGKIFNSLSCLSLIKAYCNEDQERKKFTAISEKVANHKYSIDKKNCFIIPFQEVVTITMILILVGVMAYIHVRHGRGDVATYLVYFVMLKKLSNNIAQISAFWGNFSEAKGQVLQIEKIFNSEDKHILLDGNVECLGVQKSIDVVNLNYGYPDRPLNIQNLSISFPSNQMTALVGESGSGKTTIINLLMRFYEPPEKTFYIDGVDIRSFKIESLRSKIALVDQQDLLINASLKDNLIYGLRRNVTNEEIYHVMERAQLVKLLKTLPDGLETNIGDRGVQLSGGEKQRLQIARAMLKDAEIMILDEATSALDSKTEQLIQKAISNLLENKTSILIAHRLSTIREADQIILIKSGQVVERGTFDELMKKKSDFYQHWIDQGLVTQ